mmetsp:Transcript_27/g.95  ORF Transcript_27/g.95 Transcript_27/m.95 type:complete len:329 (-) Transcript_27:282-1268(-)
MYSEYDFLAMRVAKAPYPEDLIMQAQTPADWVHVGQAVGDVQCRQELSLALFELHCVLAGSKVLHPTNSTSLRIQQSQHFSNSTSNDIIASAVHSKADDIPVQVRRPDVTACSCGHHSHLRVAPTDAEASPANVGVRREGHGIRPDGFIRVVCAPLPFPDGVAGMGVHHAHCRICCSNAKSCSVKGDAIDSGAELLLPDWDGCLGYQHQDPLVLTSNDEVMPIWRKGQRGGKLSPRSSCCSPQHVAGVSVKQSDEVVCVDDCNEVPRGVISNANSFTPHFALPLNAGRINGKQSHSPHPRDHRQLRVRIPEGYAAHVIAIKAFPHKLP